MKWLMEQKTLAGFAVALTFLLLVGVPAWWSVQPVNEMSARTTIAVVVCGSLLAITLVGLANGVVRCDFQKRQQAEQERDRFFNLSLDMLGIASTDGYFKRINPAFRQTLGWSDGELLVKSFFDFIHPDEHAAALRELQELADGKLTVQFRTRCRCQDGSWRWLSWNAVPQPDGLIYAAGRDVTQLQDAEDALRASEEFNRSIVESGQDCLKVLSLEGRLLDMAAPGRRLMCVTDFEEIRDVDWFSFWNGEDHAAARRAVICERRSTACWG